jgi:hypothetical protein
MKKKIDNLKSTNPKEYWKKINTGIKQNNPDIFFKTMNAGTAWIMFCLSSVNL